MFIKDGYLYSDDERFHGRLADDGIGLTGYTWIKCDSKNGLLDTTMGNLGFHVVYGKSDWDLLDPALAAEVAAFNAAAWTFWREWDQAKEQAATERRMAALKTEWAAEDAHLIPAGFTAANYYVGEESMDHPDSIF